MRSLTIAAFAAIMLLTAANLNAQAPADTWEPNNSFGAAQQIPGHVGGAGRVGGFGLNFLAGGNGRQFEDLLLSSGDQDFFVIPAGAITGTMVVHMQQNGFAGFPLEMEILDSTQAVISSATIGTYRTMSIPADPYNGGRAEVTTAQTGGNDAVIRIFYSGGTPIPANSSVPYAISVELSTLDSEEGTTSNNFPGFSPQAPPATTPANLTPAGPGAGNQVTRSNMTWNGWDYYMVVLPTDGSITVTLNNLNPVTTETNFDVYWVTTTGAVIIPSSPGTALAGASDSFPNGWPGNGPAAVQTPATSETLVTPNVTAGTYYFQVNAWDTFTASPSIVVPYQAGSYDIQVSYTTATDDVYEQNDDAMNPAALTAGTHNNLTLLFDPSSAEEDWYSVTLADGDNLQVRLTVDDPTTDNMNIRLYQPNAANPGQDADLVDLSIVNNTDTVTKGGTTASEVVGTWGTVGPSGNTGLPEGDWLIRITFGSVIQDGGYTLVIATNGTRNVAPEDNREPNDTLADAQDPLNTYLVLSGGLSTGLKSMDFQDWYRVENVPDTANVEISLLYDADANTDLDVVVSDIDGGPNGFDQLGTTNWANENTAASVVALNGTAGSTYVAAGQTAPGAGDIYIVVQRWNSYGVGYSLNVNINGANPLPTLRMNSVAAAPGAITVPAATTVTVAVENTGTQPQDVQTLALQLTHSAGGNVTSQYTITPPTLPVTIPAGQTQNLAFTVTSTASSVNGTITVTSSGTDGNNAQLLGTPSGTFTLTGGLAAAPDLVYTGITFSGSQSPGSTVVVRATVRNNGFLGGTYGDDGSLSIQFLQGGIDVSGLFTVSGSATPALPQLLAVGAQVQISWTYAIDSTAPLGQTQVTVSGGGNDNPGTPGTGTFNVGSPISNNPKSGGGGCSGTDAATPWLLALVALLGSALVLGRRREA